MYFVHRYARVYVQWKGHQVEFLSWDKAPNNRAFEFTSPFTIGVNPDMNSLTMYNLTDKEFGYFLQGRTIIVTAGFYNADASAKNGGIIAKGTIKSSTPIALDGTDRTVQVNFNSFPDISADTIKVKQVKKVKVGIKNGRKSSSGKTMTDYISEYNHKKQAEIDKWIKDNPNATAHERALMRKKLNGQKKAHSAKIRKKYAKTKKTKAATSKMVKQVSYVNLHYKAGTKALTIIKDVAKRAKVPLGTVKLNYNHKFANGYTVGGKPINAIKKIADSANTPVFIENGKLYIREITTGQKANLHLTPETGLISHPTPSDDGEYDGQKYEAQCLMRKEIHVGALIYVNDGVKNYGKSVVLSGQREYTTSTSTVTFQFVPYAAYQKAQADSLKKAKQTAAKDKAKADLKTKNKRVKDKAARGNVKNKRTKRHKKGGKK